MITEISVDKRIGEERGGREGDGGGDGGGGVSSPGGQPPSLGDYP